MRRSLIALAVGIPLLMGCPKDVRMESELETSNLEPHEQVREYLNERGLAREEFRVSHYFFVNGEGVPYYNSGFIFGDKIFIEQYKVTDYIVPKRNGVSHIISSYPTEYFFKGIWYIDPEGDGFNGNEIEITGLTRPTKPKETPVKCDPNERGLCI